MSTRADAVYFCVIKYPSSGHSKALEMLSHRHCCVLELWEKLHNPFSLTRSMFFHPYLMAIQFQSIGICFFQSAIQEANIYKTQVGTAIITSLCCIFDGSSVPSSASW